MLLIKKGTNGDTLEAENKTDLIEAFGSCDFCDVITVKNTSFSFTPSCTLRKKPLLGANGKPLKSGKTLAYKTINKIKKSPKKLWEK